MAFHSLHTVLMRCTVTSNVRDTPRTTELLANTAPLHAVCRQTEPSSAHVVSLMCHCLLYSLGSLCRWHR